MSKPEVSEGSGRKGREWSPEFNRTVKFYDANFDLKSEKVTGKITPAADLQSAYNLGLSQEEMIRALNTAAKNKEIAAQTEAKMGADAIPEQVLMKFIEPFRASKKIAELKGKNDADTKSLQTAAIIEQVKASEFMLDSLRAAVAKAKEEDDSEE